jgi:hypothetical protein
MTSKTPALDSQTIVLTAELLTQDPPGFIKQEGEREQQFSKAIASAYLKFTESGQVEAHSVQNFITLAEVHRALTEEVESFLKTQKPILAEDQPLMPLLLAFSSHRLHRATCQVDTLTQEASALIHQRKAEFEAVLALL